MSCEAETTKDENGKRKLFLYPCKDIDKDNVGDRPAKLNEKESDRELAREKKANDKIFLLEEKRENFVVSVRK